MGPTLLARLLLAFALASLAAGCHFSLSHQTLDGPILRQPGRWIDESGRPVVLADLAGEPFILTAVYTSCTLRCPLTIDKLRDVDAAFRRHGAPIAIWLLTIDPGKDSPERLLRYKKERHLPESWHFLHGSPEDTRALARQLRVHVAQDDGHIDHDVQIAVFDSRGELAKTFSWWSFEADDAVAALAGRDGTIQETRR